MCIHTYLYICMSICVYLCEACVPCIQSLSLAFLLAPSLASSCAVSSCCSSHPFCPFSSFLVSSPPPLCSSSFFPGYCLPIQWLQLLPIVGSGAGSGGPHNCFSRLLVLTSCYICMWFHLWVSQVPCFPKCTYHHLISFCGNPSNFSVVPLLGAPSTMQSPEVLTCVWLWHVLCSQSSQSTAFLLILLPNSFFQIPPCLPITP